MWRLSNSCLNRALQILARRDHSCAELGKKLQGRGFAEKEIRDTLKACVRLGYLDDERFADAYLNELQRKGKGIHDIRQKLYSKGISKETITNCITSRCSDKHQLNACRRALIKKIKTLGTNTEINDARPKLHRFLSGRGFSGHIIQKALEEATARKDG